MIELTNGPEIKKKDELIKKRENVLKLLRCAYVSVFVHKLCNIFNFVFLFVLRASRLPVACE